MAVLLQGGAEHLMAVLLQGKSGHIIHLERALAQLHHPGAELLMAVLLQGKRGQPRYRFSSTKTLVWFSSSF